MTTNELRDAAQRLAANAAGLRAFEPEVRESIGNTNWQCIMDCVAAVDSALQTQAGTHGTQMSDEQIHNLCLTNGIGGDDRTSEVARAWLKVGIRIAEEHYGVTALTATTNEAAAQADGRGSDLRLLLIDLDMRLRECVRLGLSAAEAYDSAYQEAVTAALAAQPVQAQGEADCWIDPHGLAQVKAGYSRCHTVATERSAKFSVPLYTHPAPAVDRGLSEARPVSAYEIPGLVSKTDHDAGLVTLQFANETAAAMFMDAYQVTVDSAALAASAPSQAEQTEAFDQQQAAQSLSGSGGGHAQRLQEVATFLRGTKMALEADAAVDCDRAANWIRQAVRALSAPSQAGSCQASGVDRAKAALAKVDEAGLSMCTDEGQATFVRSIAGFDAAPPAGRTLTAAAQDVLAERERQVIVEGYAPHHDDAHMDFSMAKAASCYALASAQLADADREWPWSLDWWKPARDPRRNLIRAGALILAEIERLDRAASSTTAGEQP